MNKGLLWLAIGVAVVGCDKSQSRTGAPSAAASATPPPVVSNSSADREDAARAQSAANLRRVEQAMLTYTAPTHAAVSQVAATQP